MKTPRTNAKIYRNNAIAFGLTDLLAIGGFITLGLTSIHPGEVLQAGVVDGTQSWLVLLLILALGFVIGASTSAVVVCVAALRQLKREALRVADGTVDGQ